MVALIDAILAIASPPPAAAKLPEAPPGDATSFSKLVEREQAPPGSGTKTDRTAGPAGDEPPGGPKDDNETQGDAPATPVAIPVQTPLQAQTPASVVSGIAFATGQGPGISTTTGASASVATAS